MTDQHFSTDEEPIDTDDEPIDLEAARAAGAAAQQKWLRQVEETIAEIARDKAAQGGPVKRVITVDELRLSGALDMPPEFRKSLSWGNKPAEPAKPGQPVQLDLFSALADKHDSLPEKPQPAAPLAPDDEEGDEESVDEVP